MALSVIFEALEHELLAYRSGVQWLVGGEHLGAAGLPPRIVIVPTEDMPAEPEMHYPDSPTAISTPRALLQMDATFEAHLWGEDFDDTVNLRDALINALRSCNAAAYRIVRGSWTVQDGQKLAQRGRVYVLTLSMPIPVMELDTAPAAILSAEWTGELTQDQALDAAAQ